MSLYTALALSFTALGQVTVIDSTNLSYDECVSRAGVLVETLYDGAICRPKEESDKPLSIKLPSGKEVQAQMKNGALLYLDKLTGVDKQLMDDLTAPFFKK